MFTVQVREHSGATTSAGSMFAAIKLGGVLVTVNKLLKNHKFNCF